MILFLKQKKAGAKNRTFSSNCYSFWWETEPLGSALLNKNDLCARTYSRYSCTNMFFFHFLCLLCVLWAHGLWQSHIYLKLCGMSRDRLCPFGAHNIVCCAMIIPHAQCDSSSLKKGLKEPYKIVTYFHFPNVLWLRIQIVRLGGFVHFNAENSRMFQKDQKNLCKFHSAKNLPSRN